MTPPLPAHLVPATRPRRFAAGLINFMSFSCALMLGEAIVMFQPQLGLAREVWATSIMSIFWILYIVRGKSIGGAFCLLEIRTHEGHRSSRWQRLIRSTPGFSLPFAFVMPATGEPSAAGVLVVLLFFTLACAIVVSGIIGLVTGASLLDRLSKTVLLQLKLPDHAKPRVFGMRII